MTLDVARAIGWQFFVTLWHVFPWLAGLGVVFTLLSALTPCNAGKPWWKKSGLSTDIAYWFTANMQWANFSAWLLSVGLIVSGLAVVAGLIDFLGDRRIRRLRTAWIHAAGNAVALVLSLIKVFVHSRDAYTSVVPTGIVLSAAVVLILLVTGWSGATLVHRYGVGVQSGERA